MACPFPSFRDTVAKPIHARLRIGWYLFLHNPHYTELAVFIWLKMLFFVTITLHSLQQVIFDHLLTEIIKPAINGCGKLGILTSLFY